MKSYFVSWCSRFSFSVSTSLLISLPSLPPTSPSSPTSSISSQRSSPGTSRLRNSLPSRSISPTLPWLPCDRRGRTPRPFSTLRFWNSCSRCWERCGATRTCYIILRKVWLSWRRSRSQCWRLLKNSRGILAVSYPVFLATYLSGEQCIKCVLYKLTGVYMYNI